jgi:hypothetical protein
MRKDSVRDGLLLLILLIGLASVVGLSRWLDSNRPPIDTKLEEEQLYLTANTARRMSLGFNGLVADWYWMRSLQYVGHKVIEARANIQIDRLGQLNLKLLAPLLDTATTLDPEFKEPYEYAAAVLPNIDLPEAIRITRKGIAANPSAWQLYQQLGYIYWLQHDYQAAAEVYAEGAKIPGAPVWMEAMKGKMAIEGGSRGMAREIYGRMYEQASDAQVKEMARRRLMQIDSLDQRDELRKVLVDYQTRVGRCPSSWKEVEPGLRALRVKLDESEAPLDPAGWAYVMVNSGCDLEVDPKSEVPQN